MIGPRLLIYIDTTVIIIIKSGGVTVLALQKEQQKDTQQKERGGQIELTWRLIYLMGAIFCAATGLQNLMVKYCGHFHCYEDIFYIEYGAVQV